MSQATEDAKDVLRDIQDFDVTSLARAEELGTSFNFSSAVPHALKVQEFYGELSYEAVDSLPDGQANIIRDMGKQTYQKWDDIMKFNPQSDPADERERLINEVEQDYDSIFSPLLPFVSYSASVTVNIKQMESEFRGIVQQSRDDAESHRSIMSQSETEANELLENIRTVSAESGVSQHAIHFKAESDLHGKRARHWKIATFVFIGVLAVYSGLALFKYDWFVPNSGDIQHEIQLIVGKVLLFAVLSSGAFLSARNFLSHTHNAIVNKHRQNALMTFKALVDASEDESDRDVILTHASACIFSPQNTGYTKSDGQLSTIDPTVVGLISKIVKGVP